MPRNKVQDLIDNVMETIEALKDPDDPMDIQRAKAVCHAAQTIVNIAKVQVDFARLKEKEGDTYNIQLLENDHKLIS
jgi:hypothetical protein